jgi:hypothetical protein
MIAPRVCRIFRQHSLPGAGEVEQLAPHSTGLSSRQAALCAYLMALGL